MILGELLFVQDIARLVPDGYSYGEDRKQDLQMARKAFEDRGIQLDSKADVYTFDVYHPDRDDMIVAFIAGNGVHKNERGAWIEQNLRQIAEENSEDLYGEDLARLVNRIANYLIANGATPQGIIAGVDEEHWKAVQQEELEKSDILDDNTAYYGIILNVADWK